MPTQWSFALLPCCPDKRERWRGDTLVAGFGRAWRRGHGRDGVGEPCAGSAGPAPGIEVDDENARCTTGFAAQGSDGGYYLMTSEHCDANDGSQWTYGDNVPLGKISASEQEGDNRDAAIIRLDPSVWEPGRHAVLQVRRGHR